MAKRYKATRDFGSVLTHQGKNVKVDFKEGWEGGVPDWQVELLAANCPGALVEVKAKKKAAPKVETAAGPAPNGQTRQVVKAPKPAAKKPKTSTKNPVKKAGKGKG